MNGRDLGNAIFEGLGYLLVSVAITAIILWELGKWLAHHVHIGWTP